MSGSHPKRFSEPRRNAQRCVGVWRSFGCVLFTIVFGLSSRAEAAQAVAEPPHALLIYGTGGVANWEHTFNDRLRGELGSELGAYFSPEFLALLVADDAEQELAARSLALKHGGHRIDLVIAVLPEANHFVTRWQHLFAPDAALLRVLPGSAFLRENRPDDGSVILSSSLRNAMAGTVELLPRLLPKLERIYLIGGAGIGDEAYLRRFQGLFSELEVPYEIESIVGLPPAELIERLAEVPEHSAVMSTTYDIDREGRPQRARNITKLIAERLELPVLALSDPQVPYGAIGGSVTSVDAYAASAGRVIRQMLAGARPADPIVSDTLYLFNGAQLDRFGVSRSVLPSESRIVNEIPNAVRDYGVWIALGAAIIVLQGVLIGSLLAARRRQRRAEESLRRAEKMELLGSLAGGIAHDFNNVLMSIMGNAELLKLDAEETMQEEIDGILAAGHRAKGLVNQILMHTRQSSGAAHHPVDLRRLVDDAIPQLQASLPAACRIVVDGDAVPMQVMGDATQIFQVLMNLVVNARHAVAGQGTISVEVRAVELSEVRKAHPQEVAAGQYVVLSVEDDGCGIDDDALYQVFEPFFTTKAPGEGTGLGLALVYQIVKAHGGSITIETEPGVGTKVSIYLPVGTERIPRSAEQGIEERVTGEGESILLVDDDPLVLEANRRLFDNLGYRVHAHGSSVAAFEAFVANPTGFDLVFSDLSMPRMDGVRLLSKIHEIRAELPSVICTGFPDALDPADVRNAIVLQKPASAGEISRVVRAALANGPQRLALREVAN